MDTGKGERPSRVEGKAAEPQCVLSHAFASGAFVRLAFGRSPSTVMPPALKVANSAPLAENPVMQEPDPWVDDSSKKSASRSRTEITRVVTSRTASSMSLKPSAPALQPLLGRRGALLHRIEPQNLERQPRLAHRQRRMQAPGRRGGLVLADDLQTFASAGRNRGRWIASTVVWPRIVRSRCGARMFATALYTGFSIKRQKALIAVLSASVLA